MSEYSQPDFYHFSEDSLWLANFVISKKLEINSILDICAGSGVVGIEVLRKKNLSSLDQATFVEMQKEFSSHIETNLKTFVPNFKSQIFIGPFSTFNSQTLYDCIVCNPPYFLKNQGREKRDIRSQVCRTFERDSLRELLAFITAVKSFTGKAYVLGRNENTNSKNLFDEFKFREVCRQKSISIYELT